MSENMLRLQTPAELHADLLRENAELRANNARVREAFEKIALHCYMVGNPNSPRYMHSHSALDAISMIVHQSIEESPAQSLAAIQDAARAEEDSK
jgi:hypothetical protein